MQSSVPALPRFLLLHLFFTSSPKSTNFISQFQHQQQYSYTRCCWAAVRGEKKAEQSFYHCMEEESDTSTLLMGSYIGKQNQTHTLVYIKCLRRNMQLFYL